MANRDFISFRTQFNGFNKEDVNNFIEEQNIRFSNAETGYRKTIEEKQQKIKDLSDRITELENNSREADLKSMKDELDQKQIVCDSLRAELLKVREENDSLKALKDAGADLQAAVDDRDKIIVSLRNELTECREKLTRKVSTDMQEAEKLAGNEGAGALYDKLSKQLGSMLIDARGIADSTVAEAQGKADKIVAEAKAKAESILAEVKNRRNISMDVVQRSVKRLTSDMSCEYLKYISDTREEFDRLLNDNSEKQKALLDELVQMSINAQTAINTEVDALTAVRPEE